MRGRALVTGAAGFVGCHVVRALVADGWRVAGVIRPGGDAWRSAALPREAEIVELDLGEDGSGVERLLHGFAPNLVVNAAARGAYAERDPVAGVRDDLLGLAHLLAALPASGCRLVALGGSLELAASDRPLGNDAPLGPASSRGTWRAAASLLVLDEARARGLEAGVLRPFTIYGPWEPQQRLVPKAIDAALRGLPLPLTAPPWPTHDYVFVEDVAEACLAAAASPAFPGAAWNVCSGRAVGDDELVDQIELVTGLEIDRRPGEWQSRHPDRLFWCGDPAGTAAGLGWVATTSLEQGIAKTAAWQKERLAGGVSGDAEG